MRHDTDGRSHKQAPRAPSGIWFLHPHIWIMGLLAAFVIMGCAPTKVQTVSEYGGTKRLPRPTRILVYDFAVSLDDIHLDRAPGAKLGDLAKGESKTELELKVGRAVANSLSAHLVKEIRALGMPAERAAGVPAPPAAGTALAIEGQFLDIDQGNRLERMVIGLGLGGTEVKTQVQVYDETPTGRRLMEEFDTTAKSSVKPGMAEMLPVGAAVSGVGIAAAMSASVATATEVLGERVEDDARRTAKKIAKNLAQFFTNQGWLP